MDSLALVRADFNTSGQTIKPNASESLSATGSTADGGKPPKNNNEQRTNTFSGKRSKKELKALGRLRATKACDQCSLKRSRCTGTACCSKCLELGLVCSYTRVVKKRGPPKKSAQKKAKLDSSMPETPISPSDSSMSYSDSLFTSNATTLSDNGYTKQQFDRDYLPMPLLSSSSSNMASLMFWNTSNNNTSFDMSFQPAPIQFDAAVLSLWNSPEFSQWLNLGSNNISPPPPAEIRHADTTILSMMNSV